MKLAIHSTNRTFVDGPYLAQTWMGFAFDDDGNPLFGGAVVLLDSISLQINGNEENLDVKQAALRDAMETAFVDLKESGKRAELTDSQLESYRDHVPRPPSPN